MQSYEPRSELVTAARHEADRARPRRRMKDRFARLRLLRGASREIRMVHQGDLRSGSIATIDFLLDRSASGPASLLASVLREGGQPPASDGARVEPGERAKIAMALTAGGRLKIVVDAAAEVDTGLLSVSTGRGQLHDRAQTVGDTVWVYRVT